ncbi:MAG TPA: HupE/UreJ family protein [Polyangia bacterium]|jgi:hypothetical protein|nr:HupE/UreJ family protein [Polyangia bacterium]
MQAQLSTGVVLVLVAASRLAWAHPAPHTVALIDVRAHRVDLELHMPVPELEAALHRPLAANDPAPRELVAAQLHAASPDGTPWRVTVGAMGHDVDRQGPNVTVQATLTPPPDHSPRTFRLVNDVIGSVVPNHVTWFSLRSDFAAGQLNASPQVLGTTHYLHHEITIDRRDGSIVRGLVAMFRLGMRHIAEGTDHLLFLLVLLLPAPLVVEPRRGRRRWGGPAPARTALANVVRVVTAFTVGHSLTLLLGATGLLKLPTALVETLIAVSILISAVHALEPLFPGKEWLVAAGFGLVHGLAFASALAELRLDVGQLAAALLAFNLGIEAMQLAVIALALPWLLLSAQTRAYRAVCVAGASGAAVAALGWIGQRALHLGNPIGPVVERLVARPFALLASLAALSIVLAIGLPRPKLTAQPD